MWCCLETFVSRRSGYIWGDFIFGHFWFKHPPPHLRISHISHLPQPFSFKWSGVTSTRSSLDRWKSKQLLPSLRMQDDRSHLLIQTPRVQASFVARLADPAAVQKTHTHKTEFLWLWVLFCFILFCLISSLSLSHNSLSVYMCWLYQCTDLSLEFRRKKKK